MIPALLLSLQVPFTQVLETQPVAVDADDPAIWVNPVDPAKSLIIGTDKASDGALYVFDLTGKTVQIVKNLDRPNNIDVEYGFDLNGKRMDIAVAAERGAKALRIFAISEGKLVDITGSAKVFSGVDGDEGAPMGIGLYRGPNGVEAFVSRKQSPSEAVLGRFKLVANKNGKVDVQPLGTIGRCTPGNEVESVAVDDEQGRVYYSEEAVAFHEYSVNGSALSVFGKEPFTGDREGIAIYTKPNGEGYIVGTEQLADTSVFHIYSPTPDHRLLATWKSAADSTDGIEITSIPLGKNWPNGLFVAMNSKGKNFKLFSIPK